MPSTEKTLHFVSSALVTAIAVGLLGYSMSDDWTVIKMECATNSNNGTATITVGLFNGKMDRFFCPVFGNSDADYFQVIPELMKTTDSVPAVLQGLVVCLLALCLLFSVCSILISLYNSVSNPYENYLGPSALYGFSSLSACLSLVAIIIFALNTILTSMGETLVQNFSQNIPVSLSNKKTEADIGLYLLIPYIVLSLLAIVCIYTYQRAAYKHKREQQRPTDDVPKEIMMY
ncbi:clarin-3 [Acanthochromis polyacanthus]|uniref:Clarin 3 n=1 Tax=Acanthochromis polyacanthus TaxID=80966 RepID=A0A3Q1FZP3_9TELE|nr:clarin-3 [Acanthochromis polyacanthus]